MTLNRTNEFTTSPRTSPASNPRILARSSCSFAATRRNEVTSTHAEPLFTQRGMCQRRCSQEDNSLQHLNRPRCQRTHLRAHMGLQQCAPGLSDFFKSRCQGQSSFQLRQPWWCPGCPLGSLWANLPPHGPSSWDTGTTGAHSRHKSNTN